MAQSIGPSEHVARPPAAGRMPGEPPAAEQATWWLTHELASRRRVEQPAYDEAHAIFGAQGLTDMLALVGAYQTVCGILNAFEVPAPQTEEAQAG